MIYALGSFIAGQTAGIVLAAIAALIWFRRKIFLLFAATAAALGGIFFVLATPTGGGTIDLRLGVILLGAYRNAPVGFNWSLVALGFFAGGIFILVAKQMEEWKRPMLVGFFVFGLLEIETAREITVNHRIETLSELAEGLQHIVGRDNHRLMLEPVPTLEDDKFTTVAVYPELEFPTSIAFTPDGGLFIGLKAGKILYASSTEQKPEQIYEIKPIQAVSESGIIDLELHPGYPKEPYLYVYYTVGYTSKNRLVRLKLDQNKVVSNDTILDDLPGFFMHNGGGTTFGPDGKLYVGLGTADYSSVQADEAIPPGPQGWSWLHGKVLRLEPDGKVPADNPQSGLLAYARGVREVFRMKFDPVSNKLFATENGIGDHDEINVIYPGGNYGYPIHTGLTGAKGFEDPVLDINKSVGITGFQFYKGDVYPSRYKDDIFFCSYVTGAIYWLPLDKQKNSRMPKGPVRAIRSSDPRMDCRIELEEGPDGMFYFSNEKGIYRLEHPNDPNAMPEQRFTDGAEIYKLYCAPCHQMTGLGVDKQFPPLAGSEWVAGDEARLARIVLFGLSGPITVKGKTYDFKMLPFGSVLDDEQLAALLTHIRKSWGNDYPPITQETVKHERENGVAVRLR